MERGLAAAGRSPDPEPEMQQQANWLLRRDLAYICWRIVNLGLETADTDALSLLRRSIELSEEALQYANSEERKLLVRKNMLYYLVDLREKLPSEDRQEAESKGRALLAEIQPKVDLEAWDVDELDTIARAESAFGDRARAKGAAKVVSQRLAERIAEIREKRGCSRAQAFEALSRDERDMYLYAQDLLASSGG